MVGSAVAHSGIALTDVRLLNQTRPGAPRMGTPVSALAQFVPGPQLNGCSANRTLSITGGANTCRRQPVVAATELTRMPTRRSRGRFRESGKDTFLLINQHPLAAD